MLASRFYHPTADINLQRADLTDGFAYYNSDIAIAAFATPTQINNEYLLIISLILNVSQLERLGLIITG
jgi:spermidine synthase